MFRFVHLYNEQKRAGRTKILNWLAATLFSAATAQFILLAHAAPAIPENTDLFIAGQDGYHTYRIPVLARATNGTILAFCEGRKTSASDTGRIDLLLKRSEDGGRTWSARQVVWSDGANACGNPAPVVDQTTGTIWLLAMWNLAADTERAVMEGRSKTGRRVFLLRSTDHGLTWSKPRDITASVKKPEWRWYATGPAAGIQLEHAPHAGRLIIPANHSEHSDPAGHPYHAHMIYSDDHGETWRIGGVLEDRTNESVIAELSDGTLLDNMRSYHGRHCRALARSTDGGLSWSRVFLEPALIDPVCEASMLRIGRRIYFANAASTRRERLTLRFSDDDGVTWTSGEVLHAGPSAYSALVSMPGQWIGCLYEAGNSTPYEKLVFARVPPSN